ncbi:hypothetical protein ACXR2U_00585 [Jatrophihabitans sp. YIM 134969]
MTTYDTEIAKLHAMVDDIRRIREGTCEPKANTNPRYLALSAAVSNLNKAIADMQAEG